MFDRQLTTHTHAPAYPQEVTHNHAATPEQARLLKDLTVEAESKVIYRCQIKNDLVQGEVCMYPSPEYMGTRIGVSFKLNGKHIQFSKIVNEYIPTTEESMHVFCEAAAGAMIDELWALLIRELTTSMQARTK